jgi:hypothetical protein
MKTIISKYGHSIVSTLFLALMVAGPLCAVGGVIISSLGASSLSVSLVRLIASVALLT